MRPGLTISHPGFRAAGQYMRSPAGRYHMVFELALDGTSLGTDRTQPDWNHQSYPHQAGGAG
jgi:hypothetical protein